MGRGTVEHQGHPTPAVHTVLDVLSREGESSVVLSMITFFGVPGRHG
ncbi:MAG TPA: hypothetical protein VGN48_05380 [Pedococcus sp.]|nr:hypothetical protein [Pedococcus sp.]